VAWVGAVTRRTSGMSRCERIHLLLIDDARRGLEDVRRGARKTPTKLWQRFRGDTAR